MGQYHLTINLTKREFIDPHKLGNGLKLWEQLGSETGIPQALFVLLASNEERGGGDFGKPEFAGVVGRWAGDRIAVVGDYAEDGDFPYRGKVSRLYNRCREKYTDISDDVCHVLETLLEVKYTGDGWRHVKREDGTEINPALAPDMILSVPR